MTADITDPARTADETPRTDGSVPGFATIVTELEARAREHPDRLFLRFRGGDLTFRAFDRRVRSLATGLRTWGAGARTTGLPILPTLLPNCADGIALWFAANRAGLVWATLNTEFRGEGLAHAINVTGSRDLVIDLSLLEFVADVAADLRHVDRLFVRGAPKPALPELAGFEVQPLQVLAGSPDGAAVERPVSSADASLLIFTSGTTGVSKACELSHAYVMGHGRLLGREMGIRGDDVLFCPYPIFHWDATVGTVVPALLNGAVAVITERFSVSRFWSDVRRYGVTVFDFMGATLTFLHKQEARPDDHDNPARLGWGVPMPAFRREFEARFGLTLVEGYGSTEGGIMASQEPGETYPDGSCGRCLPEFDLRIVDQAGVPLPSGRVGEIVVRPASEEGRHLLMTGYYGMPEANERAFREGWFHTGDLGRLDAAGNLFFEGRDKDAIRRRGENISAFEIEQVIEAHPGVLEAAAYGVPSEFTEEDVAVAVALKEGVDLTPDQLLDYCRGRMARAMVPDHVRFVPHLPKTPTEKVAKRKLVEWHVHGESPLGP